MILQTILLSEYPVAELALVDYPLYVRLRVLHHVGLALGAVATLVTHPEPLGRGDQQRAHLGEDLGADGVGEVVVPGVGGVQQPRVGDVTNLLLHGVAGCIHGSSGNNLVAFLHHL